MRKLYATLLLCAVFTFGVNAQTTMATGNNTVNVTPGVGYTDYTLTHVSPPAPIEQAGAVWNNTTVSLNSDWSIHAAINFGTGSSASPNPVYTTGADGVAFVLSPTTYLGQVGEEMGYGTTVSPSGVWTPNFSQAIEMDTWQNITTGVNGEGWRNHNDPADGADHVAFMSNGQSIHGTAQQNGAILEVGELEDGLFHDVVITWTAATSTLTITSASAPAFTASRVINRTTAFGAGVNTVSWGFTAGTGSASATQTVRLFDANTCPTSVSVANPNQSAADACHAPNTILLGYGPQCITFTATVNPSNTTGTNTFTWYAVGNANPIGTGNPMTFCPTAEGTYNVYVVVSNGTCAPVSSQPNAITVTVIDIRCANRGNDAPHKVYVCHKQNGVHGNGTIGDNAHTLCVDVDAVPAHLAHGDCLGQCPNGQRAMPNSNDLSQNESLETGFAVYPNPSNGQIQVNLGDRYGKTNIMIVNSRGMVVETRTSVSQIQSFDLKKFGTGIYVVKVISGNTVETSKIVVRD